MFAGPNGSGKSTIKEVIPTSWLGVYINPDEIEKVIKSRRALDLTDYAVTASTSEIQRFLEQSSLLINAGLHSQIAQLHIEPNKIGFAQIEVNSYWASVASDFIRQLLVRNKTSFTFETVMSSPDKVEFLCNAHQLGFRTYLYYVATEDSDINIERVRQRVAAGGHPVSKDKIVSRYKRSLNLLSDAVACADRAYIFDNSGHERIWVAEATRGIELEMKSAQMPNWFKTHLWDPWDSSESPA